MSSKRFWTSSELEYLREHFADVSTGIIAVRLDRTYRSVCCMAKNLGLHKSEAYKHKLGIAWSMYPGAVANRFRKGDVPSNKGKKIWQFMSRESIERTKATRFRTGHVPHNINPVGYERIGKCGYVYVKVENNKPMRPKHVVEWERINGCKKPEGMMVVFADGDRLNFSPDNLVLMSRSDATRRVVMSRTPEQQREIMERIWRKRNESIRKDKMRIRWGLEPKTKIVKKYYPR